MLSKNILYYGKAEPLPERLNLRAGPLALYYENGDLRYVKLGDREVVRRIYMALRDQHWGTVPGVLSNLDSVVAPDHFQITYTVDHRQGEIDFGWQGRIVGTAQGQIRFEMEGTARSTFYRNRIGFCVLHPIQECAGIACQVEKIDGTLEAGTFPTWIAPWQPFVNLRALSHEVVSGVQAKFRFTGDIFELEDQRNWSDASYKTYCTPRDWPLPVEVTAGTVIRQAVEITLQGDWEQAATADQLSSLPLEDRTTEKDIIFIVDPQTSYPLPKIGLGMTHNSIPVSPAELEHLRELNLSHLRVDLPLKDHPQSVQRLQQATEVARAIAVDLEIALFLAADPDQELQHLAAALEDIAPPVGSWLIFHEAEAVTAGQWVELARTNLADYCPTAAFRAGTNVNFTELNRDRPSRLQQWDGVNYGLCPQIHAFDNISLVENLATQSMMVASARQFIGDLPLSISPITLKRRAQPQSARGQSVQGTSNQEEQVSPDAMPPQADLRQASLFGAGWTLGSLKTLAEAGVDRATYYEIKGWLGVIADAAESPSSIPFPACQVFPVYYVFADVGEFRGGTILKSCSSNVLKVEGMVLRQGSHCAVLLANLTETPQAVVIPHWTSSIQFASVRLLDETTAISAMATPQKFRTQDPSGLSSGSEELKLVLQPYGVARIDLELGD